jgi:hypothetical protein
MTETDPFATAAPATVTELPEQFDFDLDSWEPDPAELKEPLRIKVGGRVVQFNDPRDRPWTDLVNLQNPAQFIRVCTNTEDRDHIYEQGFSSRKLDALMKKFMKHFEIEEAVAEAQRQAQIRGLG